MPIRLLIVTNQFDPHADHVISILRQRGIEFFRLNTEEYPRFYDLTFSFPPTSCIIKARERELHSSSIAVVWYRKPDPFELHPEITNPHHQRFAEQQCRSALSGLWNILDHAFWVSHPQALAKAERKIFQLDVAHRLGFLLPRTTVTSDPDVARSFLASLGSDRKAIAKSVGYAAGYSIFTSLLSLEQEDDLEAVKYAPVMLQEYVPKKFEIRVNVIGNRVLAAEIHSQRSSKTSHDWRHYDFDNVPHRPHTLPRKLEEMCVSLLHALDLRFGAIDMILTPNDDYVFLEINPNGQWLWLETLVGLPIGESIVELFEQNISEPLQSR